MSSINLLQGNCFELMKNIPDESIDMILTDPPYGIEYQGWRKNRYKKIKK